jgi:GTP cyclohydrolase II
MESSIMREEFSCTAPSAAVQSGLRSEIRARKPLVDDGLAVCNLPTVWGDFRLAAMNDPVTGEELIALFMGDVADGKPVLTRLHSECLTGDGFFSLKCDCGPQLEAAMKAVAAEGRGIVVYLRQEGRGIGLVNKVRAYALQDRGADTVDANRLLGLPDDARRYDGAARILAALGVTTVRLMTNNPAKLAALADLGVEVAERVPLQVGTTRQNLNYLRTKAERMGHMFQRMS